MKFQLGALVAISAILVSCSPRYAYFTDELYKQNKWSQDELQRIQFYVSKDILLTRTIKSGESAIREGKIRIKNGERIEQVVIHEGTPGVLVFMPKENRMAVSFDDSDTEAYLMFGPNPKHYNRYALLAQDWERHYGKVHYKGQVYDVDASAAFASLMVDLRRQGETQYRRHTAQGRKVGN